MRRYNAALIVAASLAVAGQCHADDSPARAAEPNAIVWLFSDIGNLLKSASSALQTSDAKDASKPEKQVEPAAPKTAHLAIVQPPAPPEAVIANVSSVKTKTENPIAAFFNSIAGLFKPSLEIDTLQAAPKAVAAEPAKTVAHQSAPPVPVAIETAAAATGIGKASNPLAWLFNDLASAFSPSLEIEQRRDQPITVTEASPARHEPVPADVVEVTPSKTQKTAQAASTDGHKSSIGWLISGIAKLFEVSTVAAPPAKPEPTVIADATPQSEKPVLAPAPDAARAAPEIPREVAVNTLGAPWMPASDTAIFNPDEPLFDGARLPPLAATPAHRTIETRAVAEVIQPAPPLRTLPPVQPEVRSYRDLGQHNKAVTPPPNDGFIANLVETFIGESNASEGAEPLANKISDRIVAEEKLDLGHVSPDAEIREGSVERIGTGPLADIDLYLGEKTTIGAPYRAQDFDKQSCLEQPVHGTVFCLAQLGWPSEIAPSFALDTAYTLPGEGVLRFENGLSSRVYAIFKAGDFANVVKFMQHRFGPPMEREIVWMHMMEAPKMPNTTFRWTGITRDRKDTIVLEVRNYDDLRRSFADMNHGMVRLYRNGSRPIFKHLSTMDLMLMQRRRLADAPAAAEAVAPQK